MQVQPCNVLCQKEVQAEPKSLSKEGYLSPFLWLLDTPTCVRSENVKMRGVLHCLGRICTEL